MKTLNKILNLFFLFFLFPFTFSENFHDFSKVFHDISNEFFVKNHVPLDIVFWKSFNDETSVIFKNLTKINKIRKFFECPFLIQSIEYLASAIIFVATINEFEQLNNCYYSLRYGKNPMIYAVYVSNFSILDLKNSNLMTDLKIVDIFTWEIFFHAFFIINEDDLVTLATIEWFGECFVDFN